MRHPLVILTAFLLSAPWLGQRTAAALEGPAKAGHYDAGATAGNDDAAATVGYYGAAARAGSAANVAAPAISMFLSRTDEPLQQYRALRHMEAHNARFNLRGSLDAMTTLGPDGRFTYTVIREEGSEYIRNKVLRELLENEEKLFATTDPARAALSASNYELNGGELVEPGVIRLLAKPRRRDVSLVDGSIFVTSRDADLLRVEGRLARNPSFWTTRVDVVRRYERVGGIRVPVRLDTTAQIRMAGTATMTVVYGYEMINGVTLK